MGFGRVAANSRTGQMTKRANSAEPTGKTGATKLLLSRGPAGHLIVSVATNVRNGSKADDCWRKSRKVGSLDRKTDTWLKSTTGETRTDPFGPIVTNSRKAEQAKGRQPKRAAPQPTTDPLKDCVYDSRHHARCGIDLVDFVVAIDVAIIFNETVLAAQRLGNVVVGRVIAITLAHALSFSE